MSIFKHFMRCIIALAFLTMTASTAMAYTVYYDNTDTKWEQPKIYFWNPNWTDAQKPAWPGKNMAKYTGNANLSNIWYYEVNDDATGIIFNNVENKSGTQTMDYMGDKTRFADKVFGFAEKNSGASIDDVILGDINSYSQGGGDAGNVVAWSVHFHNKSSWDNVYVRISGGNVSGGKMEAFLNGVIYDYQFEAPKDAPLQCSFYTLSNGSETNTTDTWNLKSGHVYTQSGDKGPKEEYDPVNTLPEKEYWLEPEMPSQLQEATLWFNRAYVAESKLRNCDEIYLWTGLIAKGDADSKWSYAPSNWNNLGEKYKMEQDASNPDLFKITFTPSIASWFGASQDDRFAKLAFIFRDKSGNTKQHASDQFILLKQIADPSAGMGALISYQTANGTVTITSEKGKLMLTPVSDQVVKVFTLRNGDTVTEERQSISVADEAFTNPTFSILDNENDITVNIDGGVKVHVDKATCRVSFHDVNDNLYLREMSGLSNTPGKIEVSFEGMGDEGFYGGGYNGNHSNWEGKTMVMNNTQTGNWGQGTSHPHNICVPFYVSTKGYGVYFDDHYRGAHVSPTATGSTYSSSSRNPIAYYFIGGGQMENGHGSMQQAVEEYTRLTGLQELPPYWALGYITSKFSFASRAEAENTVRKTKEMNVPLDAIVFDIHWQGGVSKMGRIDWDTSNYPNPQEMIANFRNENVHTIAITEPFFTNNSGNYQTMKDRGFFSDDHVNNMEWLQSDHVGLLDVTNPEAIEWFKDLYKKRTLEGIEGWWLDLGEPERHDSESTYMLGDINQVHNEYGNRWCEFVLEALKECKPDTRHMLMPRAGTSGMQRFNTFPWTGDIARTWEGLKAQVPALVSGAMSGVSYLGSDIGGFIANGTNADLYRRWVQLGIFYPSMRTHSATAPEVWQDAYSGIRNDVRKAINLRYAYLPYTYTQSYTYSRFGTPIARPANFADSNPSVLANCRDAYLWGPDIFVAPVLDSSERKEITFPEGEWLDMNDFTTIYSCHSSVSYSAPKSTLPHFMRRGSFITRYRQDTFTSTAEIDHNLITVHYFPSYSQTSDMGEYYDDDHSTVNPFDMDSHLLTRFSAKCTHDANSSITLNIEREGFGWDNMYDNAPQDILFQIHDFRLGKPNLQVKVRRTADEYTYEHEMDLYGSGTSEKEVSSLDEVLAENSRVSYAIVNDKMYLRLPQIEPNASYALLLTDEGVTSTPSITDASMSLAYADGIITYSAPSYMDSLTLDVYSTTGAKVAEYRSLTANGTASQLNIELAKGVYITRLTGISDGEAHTKTLKMVVL